MNIRTACSSTLLASILALVPQLASAECPLCGGEDACCQETRKCCRPNRVKIIIKRSHLAAPPQGFAVASVPAVMVAAPAFTVQSAATAGITPEAFRQAVADEVRRASAASAPAAVAAPAANQTCTDPCGDIKRLQKDVADLIAVTDRLTVAVEKLHKKVESQQVPPAPTPAP